MNLSYYHQEFFQTETTGVKLYPDYKSFGEFVFCLRYLLDGTQEERVFQRMRLHWLMQCYCRQETDEDTVKCCNPSCAIQKFHLSCLGINTVPKTWYCPRCRALPEFKKRGSKQHSANSKQKLTHVSTHTKQTVTQTSTNTGPNLTDVTTNTNQTVTHVTSHSRQTVTHNTTRTKQKTTHISANTGQQSHMS